ncbi:hypothetical protein EGW08_000307 [Elysia chlorotica]|uniref:Sushi domain-containing protein n=1 Tax=Elysia chlorotica TaxID=188477 RepID=A0A3S1BV33_ELYCH|nr:hypothetical protein EGW08_000307 [Elysia chlorotica]
MCPQIFSILLTLLEKCCCDNLTKIMNSAGLLAIFLCFCILKFDSTVEAASIQERQSGGYDPFYHDCLVHGRHYRHGEIFSIPGYSHCLEYRCNRGGWSIVREACEVEGQCRPVGHYFDTGCRTYRCDKEDRGNYFYYQPTLVRTMCEDINRACRRPGDTFSKVLNGRRYDQCQCIVSNSGQIRYSCSSSVNGGRH